MIWNQAELYNVQELIPFENGVCLSRVPREVRNGLSEMAQKMALYSAGMEIRFRLLGEKAVVRLRRVESLVGKDKGCGLAELYHGSYASSLYRTPCYITNEVTEIIVSPPADMDRLIQLNDTYGKGFDPRLIRIVLPYDTLICLIEIEGDVAPPNPDQIPQKRYLAYGSSITQGYSVVAPSDSYAMLTARSLNFDLINLGFAGSARLEAELADHIAERGDWDLATLEMGANVITRFSIEQFKQHVDYFVSVIVERNPDKPIFCMDMFRIASELSNHTNVEAFRRIVRAKVESLNRLNVKYIDAWNLLPSVEGLGVDLLHPTSYGMRMIAERLANELKGAAYIE